VQYKKFLLDKFLNFCSLNLIAAYKNRNSLFTK